jgi:hypothetical protein
MGQSNVIDVQQSLIDAEVIKVYEQVVDTCNKIIRQAKVFGFSFMEIPDPNIHSIASVLDNVIIPILDNLCKSGNFSPESGIKMANIKQYTLHIREIALALEENDRLCFERSVAALASEAMLF